MRIAPSIPKKSASLLLLRPTPPTRISFFNYDLLVLKRSKKMTFGSALVFPGGKLEPQVDQSYQTRYSLYDKLQSTALRQTFEETGLFFSRKHLVQSEVLDKLSKIKQDFIINTLNSIPQATKTSYEQLSQLLNPTKNLLPFIRMITVPFLKSRYDTTFYVLPIEEYKYLNFSKYLEHQKYLHNIDQLLHCSHQYTDFRWMNPAEILSQHFSKKSVVAPPQFIMLDIMLRFRKYQGFIEYLRGINGASRNQLSNYNLGPNVISLVKNTGSNATEYPFAATLVGDKQFPYDKIMTNQTCQSLKDEVKQWQTRMHSRNAININRFLFKQNKKFFETEFQVVCDTPQSVISQMRGWNSVRGSLQQLIF